jgi:nucleoside-diphosphate-sugar epimerase
MSLISVLGSSGFIGSHLVKRINELGLSCFAPERDEDLSHRRLGNVIYCIGLTADFRTRPFDTVNAHVCKLLQILQTCEFDSLVYLSSTRLYLGGSDQPDEESEILVDPLNPDSLYNLSKLMGESLALSSGKPVRVVRLSNVYGDDFLSQNFLAGVIRDAVQNRKVILYTSLDSEKDYVSISDVVDALIKIATSGRQDIYNIASGRNVSNLELMERIRQLTSCEIEVAPGARRSVFPLVNIDRLTQEFHFRPAFILDDLPQLVDLYKCSVHPVL